MKRENGNAYVFGEILSSTSRDDGNGRARTRVKYLSASTKYVFT
jgi:hypothetical protein